MALITLTLDQNLYRRPAPTNEQTALGYRPFGEKIDVEKIVFGKTLEKNNIWYQASDSCYYWSGGINLVDFALTALSFNSLSPSEQWAICQQALVHYAPMLKRDYPDLTVLSISLKRMDQQPQTTHSIVFFVVQKQQIPAKRLPKKLFFKGFIVPTDVQEAQPPVLCSLGELITKPNPYNSIGTLGFVAVAEFDNTSRYLVTNYHVLCSDRLSENRQQLTDIDEYDEPHDRAVVHTNRQIGELIDGSFDDYADCVKALLTNGNLTNQLPNGTFLTGIVRRSDGNAPKFNDRIHLAGMMSGGIVSGRVESLFATTPQLANINHSFYDVIQVRLKAQKGDSGGPVFTDDNKLIGILAASDLHTFSYVIPISIILTRLNLTQLAQP